MSRLSLGTASFGMPYGIAGHPLMEVKEMSAILDSARAHGVTSIDTAPGYGEAESRLGAYGMRTRDMEWTVTTKLPPVPDGMEVQSWVRATVRESLHRLKLPRLHALLLHRPMDLLGPHGAGITEACQLLKTQGLVSHLGLSIEGPEVLGDLLPIFPVEIVQAPFNVLDRRLADSGWLARLHSKGIQVQVRSVFLQGLLLMREHLLPPQFQRWEGIWDQWGFWLDVQEMTPLQGCLQFLQAYPMIDQIIVGVDSVEHWLDIFDSMRPVPYPLFASGDIIDLITPSRWGSL